MPKETHSEMKPDHLTALAERLERAAQTLRLAAAAMKSGAVKELDDAQIIHATVNLTGGV